MGEMKGVRAKGRSFIIQKTDRSPSHPKWNRVLRSGGSTARHPSDCAPPPQRASACRLLRCADSAEPCASSRNITGATCATRSPCVRLRRVVSVWRATLRAGVRAPSARAPRAARLHTPRQRETARPSVARAAGWARGIDSERSCESAFGSASTHFDRTCSWARGGAGKRWATMRWCFRRNGST